MSNKSTVLLECRPSAKMGQIGGVENPRVLRWCELLEWG